MFANMNALSNPMLQFTKQGRSKHRRELHVFYEIHMYNSFFLLQAAYAYAQGNEKWRNLKILGDHEKIEKDIDRMILEYKSKQSQAFVIHCMEPTPSEKFS